MPCAQQTYLLDLLQWIRPGGGTPAKGNHRGCWEGGGLSSDGLLRDSAQYVTLQGMVASWPIR